MSTIIQFPKRSPAGTPDRRHRFGLLVRATKYALIRERCYEQPVLIVKRAGHLHPFEQHAAFVLHAVGITAWRRELCATRCLKTRGVHARRRGDRTAGRRHSKPAPALARLSLAQILNGGR